MSCTWFLTIAENAYASYKFNYHITFFQIRHPKEKFWNLKGGIMVTWAPKRKHQRPSGLNSGNWFSDNSGGWNHKSKVWVEYFSSEASLWFADGWLLAVSLFGFSSASFSVCSPDCPWTPDSLCLCLLGTGITGVCHHVLTTFPSN